MRLRQAQVARERVRSELDRALLIMAEATDNLHEQQLLRKLHERIQQGQNYSVALAEHFGPRLDETPNENGEERPYDQFVSAMNRYAEQLGMPDMAGVIIGSATIRANAVWVGGASPAAIETPVRQAPALAKPAVQARTDNNPSSDSPIMPP